MAPQRRKKSNVAGRGQDVMNQNVLDFAHKHLSSIDIKGKRVLEIGSYNVNGTIRDVIEPMEPMKYVGVDVREGLCVDEVCDACLLVERFGEESFDFVVTCSTLCHIKNWRQAISSIKRVCKCQGVVFIVANARWQYRTYGSSFGSDYYDYWRYTEAVLTTIFSDFKIEVLHADSPKQSLVYLIARKPESFVERGLANIEIPSAKAQNWGHAHYE